MPDPAVPEKVARAFLAAYNAIDLDAIASLIAPEIVLVPYGRGVDLRGSERVLAGLTASATGAFADRRFGPPRRVTAARSRVAVEHTWTATAAADVANFAAAGETVEMELCTVFTIADGRITEYIEYG
jgi:steroid delta-isomerase-like uncharacterized protein